MTLTLRQGRCTSTADEQIDGAVATVLAIVTFQLPWFGRDRLAHLADQLHRALVEADHRPLGIGRFGIKVEHVFHAGNTFAVDPRNAPQYPCGFRPAAGAGHGREFLFANTGRAL